jgi:hypothetical protein
MMDEIRVRVKIEIRIRVKIRIRIRFRFRIRIMDGGMVGWWMVDENSFKKEINIHYWIRKAISIARPNDWTKWNMHSRIWNGG